MKTTFIVPLATLHARVPKRLPGYLEECLRRGQIDASHSLITFTRRDFMEIRRAFNPNSSQPHSKGCCG